MSESVAPFNCTLFQALESVRGKEHKTCDGDWTTAKITKVIFVKHRYFGLFLRFGAHEMLSNSERMARPTAIEPRAVPPDQTMAQSNGNGSGVLPSELLADGAVIGAKVRVVTQADDTFEGTIFTLDPVASFLILGASLFPSLANKILLQWEMNANRNCCYVYVRVALSRRAFCRQPGEGQDAHVPDRSAQEVRGADASLMRVLLVLSPSLMLLWQLVDCT